MAYETKPVHSQTPVPAHPSKWHSWMEFYDRNVSAIQWGIIGIALVAACGIYWYRSTAATEAAAWSSLAQANDAEQYAQVASVHAGTQAAVWASLREAQLYLETGLKAAFTDREKANIDLKKATELLDQVLKGNPPRDVREQALFAHARALEMTADGKVEPVISEYEALLKEFPDSVYAEEAQRSVHRLKAGNAQNFYAWFSKQNPKPAPPPQPRDTIHKPTTPIDPHDPAGVGSLVPETELPNLDKPLFNPLTSPDEALKPGEPGDKDKPAEPGTEKPADDTPTTEKPADEKPADEKPADDKPAEEKPADEKPAEDKPAEEKPADEKPAEAAPADPQS